MKRNKLPIATAILAIIIIGILVFTIITYNKEITKRKDSIEKLGMKLVINKNEYPVSLSNTNTTLELLNTLPLNGNMASYEDSFYIIRISKKFSIDGEKTNNLEAQNLYYNPSWESLVLVYKDYKYTKNKMVHIGKLKKEVKTRDIISKVIIQTERD